MDTTKKWKKKQFHGADKGFRELTTLEYRQKEIDDLKKLLKKREKWKEGDPIPFNWEEYEGKGGRRQFYKHRKGSVRYEKLKLRSEEDKKREAKKKFIEERKAKELPKWVEKYKDWGSIRSTREPIYEDIRRKGDFRAIREGGWKGFQKRGDYGLLHQIFPEERQETLLGEGTGLHAPSQLQKELPIIKEGDDYFYLPNKMGSSYEQTLYSHPNIREDKGFKISKLAGKKVKDFKSLDEIREWKRYDPSSAAQRRGRRGLDLDVDRATMGIDLVAPDFYEKKWVGENIINPEADVFRRRMMAMDKVFYEKRRRMRIDKEAIEAAEEFKRTGRSLGRLLDSEEFKEEARKASSKNESRRIDREYEWWDKTRERMFQGKPKEEWKTMWQLEKEGVAKYPSEADLKKRWNAQTRISKRKNIPKRNVGRRPFSQRTTMRSETGFDAKVMRKGGGRSGFVSRRIREGWMDTTPSVSEPVKASPIHMRGIRDRRTAGGNILRGDKFSGRIDRSRQYVSAVQQSIIDRRVRDTEAELKLKDEIEKVKKGELTKAEKLSVIAQAKQQQIENLKKKNIRQLHDHETITRANLNATLLGSDAEELNKIIARRRGGEDGGIGFGGAGYMPMLKDMVRKGELTTTGVIHQLDLKRGEKSKLLKMLEEGAEFLKGETYFYKHIRDDAGMEIKSGVYQAGGERGSNLQLQDPDGSRKVVRKRNILTPEQMEEMKFEPKRIGRRGSLPQSIGGGSVEGWLNEKISSSSGSSSVASYKDLEETAFFSPAGDTGVAMYNELRGEVIPSNEERLRALKAIHGGIHENPIGFFSLNKAKAEAENAKEMGRKEKLWNEIETLDSSIRTDKERANNIATEKGLEVLYEGRELPFRTGIEPTPEVNVRQLLRDEMTRAAAGEGNLEPTITEEEAEEARRSIYGSWAETTPSSLELEDKPLEAETPLEEIAFLERPPVALEPEPERPPSPEGVEAEVADPLTEEEEEDVPVGLGRVETIEEEPSRESYENVYDTLEPSEEDPRYRKFKFYDYPLLVDTQTHLVIDPEGQIKQHPIDPTKKPNKKGFIKFPSEEERDIAMLYAQEAVRAAAEERRTPRPTETEEVEIEGIGTLPSVDFTKSNYNYWVWKRENIKPNKVMIWTTKYPTEWGEFKKGDTKKGIYFTESEWTKALDGAEIKGKQRINLLKKWKDHEPEKDDKGVYTKGGETALNNKKLLQYIGLLGMRAELDFRGRQFQLD
jgi:hypothetical protein